MPANADRNDCTRAGGEAGETMGKLGLGSGYSERLRALIECPPKFKAGQIRALWPQIRDAIGAGHKLKQIWECLDQNGLQLSYSRFRYYVAMLKRAEPKATSARPGSGPVITGQGANAERTPHDALANLRDRLSNRPGFEFDSQPPDLKKLV